MKIDLRTEYIGEFGFYDKSTRLILRKDGFYIMDSDNRFFESQQ